MFIKIGTAYEQAAYKATRLYPIMVSCGPGLRGIKFYAEMLGQQSDMTIPEARELIVRQVDFFVSEICGYQEVVSALEGNVLGALEIAILFPWDQAGASSIDNLAAVFICDGMVHYELHDAANNAFYGLHQESYQDAVGRVKNPPEEEILNTPLRRKLLNLSKEEKRARLMRACMQTQYRLLKYGLSL